MTSSVARTVFYHASPRRFRHGDVLCGGHQGGAGYAHYRVCMTDSPAPHGTVWQEAVRGDWFVYEVEPLYDAVYNDGNCEFQTQAARVLRCVGRAEALSRKRRAGARWDKYRKGFFSYPQAVPRRGVRALIIRTACSNRAGRLQWEECRR